MPDHRQNAPQPATSGQPCVEPAIAIHEVRFHRNARNGRYRAVCTCGWARFGSEAEVTALAASHDLDDWQNVEPAVAAGAP